MPDAPTDFTVADIVGARPGLKDRAKQAHAEALEARDAARLREQEELINSAIEWLRDVADLLSDELEDVTFEGQTYSPQRQCVIFRVDGITLRAHYDTKTVGTVSSIQFDDSKVEEDVLVISVLKSHNTWATGVKTLADLGSHLR